MNNFPAVKVDYQVGQISSNLKDIREAVEKAASEYKGLVITPEAVAEGKRTLASLRKEKKALDDSRKEIKRAWLKPFEEWEKEAKEIISLYDVPEEELNAQIKEYEEARKEEKRNRIREMYSEIFAGYEEYFPLERIFAPKWENATYQEADIRNDLETEKRLSVGMIEAVKALNSKYEKEGLEVLKKNSLLHEAIGKIRELEEQEKRIVEEVKQEELSFPEPEKKREGKKYICYVKDADVKGFLNFCSVYGIEIEEG